MKKILKYLIILGILQSNSNASSEPPTTHMVESANNLEMIRVEPGSLNLPDNTVLTVTEPYYLGKYEVTQSQYKAITGQNPSHRGKGDNIPIHKINWHKAVSFATKINELETSANRLNPNWKYDLPSKNEWKYACRAGTKTKYYWGDEYNASLVTIKRSAEVGTLPPNPWGFYDMHGNVYEWTADWYQSFTPNAVTDPTGAESNDDLYLVRKGGSYAHAASMLRSAERFYHTPGSRRFYMGFRLAMISINP